MTIMNGRPIKILAVEDSENDFRLAMRVLRKAGFAPEAQRVQDLPSLRQALREGLWDALISDFSMPGFSGLQALAEFRGTGIDIPFIFVSGTIGEEMAVAAMQAGANDYVMKENLRRLGPALERELAQAAQRAAHRLAETELRRFEAQLHQAQKMESLGTLAGGIAHDFNNILGAILGNIELAMLDLEPQHPVQAALGEIQLASLRARDLVRQILTFSRRRPQQLENMALKPIVEETFRLLRATLPAGVELRQDLAEAPLYVHADATQLQQVLMNLCTNAWHALHDKAGGLIVIGLDAAEIDAGDAQARGLDAGAYAHLWVRDTGSGMDARTLERVFEPFFTTKSTGQGTGLGLSVVHGIVAAHHGSITVDTLVGEGSTFHVLLPANSEPLALPADRERAALVEAHGEHVVYLDDDETVMLVMVRILERAGYRCSGFLDAAAALASIKAAPASVDVFITDYNMPGRSGLEVAREAAALNPDLPIAISTGLITDDLRERARALGVLAVIQKENAFREIVPLVRRLLEKSKT